MLLGGGRLLLGSLLASRCGSKMSACATRVRSPATISRCYFGNDSVPSDRITPLRGQLPPDKKLASEAL
jgi:hypothetical protein